MAGSKPELLTEAEAAEYLKVTPTTLARVRRAGGIGYIKVAQRSYRYTEAILDEYVRLSTVEPRLWVLIRDRDRRSREAAARREARARNEESYQDKPPALRERPGETLGSGVFRRKVGF
jgi:excisionase family DNA binding protein